MDDDTRIVSGLSPEQMIERAQSLTLECAYWQHVLEDAETINAGARDATLAVLDAVKAALAIVAHATPEQLPHVEAIIEQCRKAVDGLQVATNGLGGIIELAAGRQAALEPIAVALRRSAGVEADGGDEVEQ